MQKTTKTTNATKTTKTHIQPNHSCIKNSNIQNERITAIKYTSAD